MKVIYKMFYITILTSFVLWEFSNSIEFSGFVFFVESIEDMKKIIGINYGINRDKK